MLADFAYAIDGVLVSDFYTPVYFQAHRTLGAKYDFTGHIEQPRQVLRGGLSLLVELGQQPSRAGGVLR